MGAFDAMKREASTVARQGRANLALSLRITLVLWLIEGADTLLLGGRLDAYGIRPRSLSGLWGILCAPFLHAGLGHLLANTLPLLVLGTLTMARRQADFWVVSAVSALTAGLGAWLLGAPGTVHIGASGVIFGYFGFLLARGIYERRAGAIGIAILVAWLFGPMVVGVLPSVGVGISWQSHLFGFLGGALTGRLLGRGIRGR